MYKEIEGLDELDNKIIEILEIDARKSYTEIAEDVGVTRVSVKNRIKALEKRGIIRGYKAIIDPTGTGETTKFFITLDVEPENFNDAKEFLQQSPFIRELYMITGHGRFYATGYASSSRSIREFVGKLYELKGAKNIGVNTVIAALKKEGGIGDEGHKPE